MQVMLYEIKKMYIIQKGLLFVLLFALLGISVLLVFNKPSNSSLEEHRGQYFVYLDKVSGQLSSEKEQYLQTEARILNEAQISLDRLYDQYYDGKIEEQAFKQEQVRLENILQNQDGFEQIFEQYVFVRENPENRYFVYANGWNALLSGETVDFYMVLIILLLVTPVFCSEFENAMDSLTATMKKGGSYGAMCKIALVFISITLLCLFSVGLRYVFFSLKYGLPNGDYPIQSLNLFSSSVKNVSLMQAFIYTSLLKLMGYLCFATMIMFLSVWVKKYALTLFAASACILLPLIGIENGAVKYLYTGPLGLMMTTGYFKGSLFTTDRFTKETTQIFEEIGANKILFLLLFLLVGIILMLYIILRLSSNHWCRLKRKNGSNICAVACMCAVLFTLCGCSSSVNCNIYNSDTRMSFQNENYRFYVDESDTPNTRIVCENLKTGEVESLVRTPLQTSNEIAKTIYGNGDFVYYIKYNVNKSAFRDFNDRISIIEIDTKTFSERIIYENNIELNKKLLMGTISQNTNDLFFLHGVNAFFLDETNIYFLGSDNINCLNRVSGKIKQLNIPTNNNIAYDGQRIYYIGNRYELSYFDIKTDSYEVVPGIAATRFFLSDNEMLFLNRLDEKKLYTLSLSDYKIKKILDKTVLSFYCDNDFIYYQDREDFKEYKIDKVVS